MLRWPLARRDVAIGNTSRRCIKQINDGGAEALFYDLRGMDLGDWHPREIPETLLRNPALQEQQGHTLPPWEQWYVMLLHNGKLPGALTKKPNTSLTHSLLSHARDKVPRLRWEGEIALRDFVIDQKRLGIACTKAAPALPTAGPFRRWRSAAQRGSECTAQ